jgi:hypothetical protein
VPVGYPCPSLRRPESSPNPGLVCRRDPSTRSKRSAPRRGMTHPRSKPSPADSTATSSAATGRFSSRPLILDQCEILLS